MNYFMNNKIILFVKNLFLQFCFFSETEDDIKKAADLVDNTGVRSKRTRSSGVPDNLLETASSGLSDDCYVQPKSKIKKVDDSQVKKDKLFIKKVYIFFSLLLF